MPVRSLAPFNDSDRQQNVGKVGTVLGMSQSDGGFGFNLDPFTAKQMAALQATSLAKAGNRSVPGATSGATSAPYFGGMSTNQTQLHSRPDSQDSHAFPPLPDLQAPIPPMNVRPFLPSDPLRLHSPPPPFSPQPPPQNNHAMQQELVRQRKRSWLQGLATLMAQRLMPLPPQLTGVPFPPNYNPLDMPWKSLEVSHTDLGVIRLAGKDVDLFRLWGIVLGYGGGQAVRVSTLISPCPLLHAHSPSSLHVDVPKGLMAHRPRHPWTSRDYAFPK